MAIRYKINIVDALKAAGYSTYRIRKEKLFGEAVLQKLRTGEPVTFEILNTICEILKCQPGDIIEYTNQE